MERLEKVRDQVRKWHRADEKTVVNSLISNSHIGQAERVRFQDRAVDLINRVRNDDEPGLMEVFLAEYGLSTDEGIALMCLAEALLRVPDAETIDDLIEDKIAPSEWGLHLGHSSSSLVNASTWGLMLTGKVLDEPRSRGMASVLHGAIRRLGEPVIRTAVKRAMRELGNQFVLGETIQKAIENGDENEAAGYTYSYDMLGEAALTAKDAKSYFEAYRNAILALGKRATSGDIRENPGISIKLSALHPRYEWAKRDRVLDELVPTVRHLALLAKGANMGFNIDAEEADRLDLSLDIIHEVLRDPALTGWDGFGVVVQAYGRRAAPVLDWLYELARTYDRLIMVRLVKGAYWDTEIKQAQVEGVADFPVFTHKAATDVSYLCCAEKLLAMTDRIYPQFATHNAHTVAAILEMANDPSSYEFQRLHGMGETLHRIVKADRQTRCRIYAPVGAHRDLLAYLVRRLLENGANSSFVNQIVDAAVSAETIARDPFIQIEGGDLSNTHIVRPPCDLFQPDRKNAVGWDLRQCADVSEIETARRPFVSHRWHAAPILVADATEDTGGDVHRNPFDDADVVGTVLNATPDQIDRALSTARPWAAPPEMRARILREAADLYEKNFGELFACLAREAGKTIPDAVAELREAVDFLRYYAARISDLEGKGPRGVFACISPWNFPLAIFTGQIAAALAAGNGVIAKPAEQSPIIGSLAVELLHKAGVPKESLQFLPGDGATVGSAITSDPRVGGVCFTGSTETAQTINKSMARHLDPAAPLIAETGGLNAMIVDSTALPEQAVGDIIVSAFQSAGQRCSALRMLYVQEDIAPAFLEMLYGAMDELSLGNPWELRTDIGPVIDADAQSEIRAYIDTAISKGWLLKQLRAPKNGTFVAPTVLSVDGIDDLEREIFGPVLHVATYRANQLDAIINSINARGFGLTFGLHSRIDDRVQKVASRIKAGNLYINRNQIGAIVGSQPFGGEGLSGTGPKAGGPNYMRRFMTSPALPNQSGERGTLVSIDQVQAALDLLPAADGMAKDTVELPGPTGESNRLSIYPRGKILCLGPTWQAALQQRKSAIDAGCPALIVTPGASGRHTVDGVIDPDDLIDLDGIAAVTFGGDETSARAIRQALAERSGPIIPLLTEVDMHHGLYLERHLCVDTTAAGGNAKLLAQASNE